MTDNKEVKMVNENMDNDNETHNKDIQEFHHVTNGYNPDLIVDDSEGSEGSIHELSQSQNSELDKEEVKSQNQDKTFNVLNDPELDKLEAKEDKKPWKLEDEMTEADKEYYDKIKNTKVSPEQHFKTAVLKVMSHMDSFSKA